MSEFQRENIALWNELADIHEQSQFYGVQSFIEGRQTLHDIEIKELPDISGKSLLHLQCHFGLDTLSWSRLGAKSTGVDFSDKAINLATKLATQLHLDAKFIHSDVYDLAKVLDSQFDVVFTSYGVLSWLPDLSEWAKIVHRFLKPGGTFLIVDEHPVSYMMDPLSSPANLQTEFSYFAGQPLELQDQYSYADNTTKLKQPVHYEWSYNLDKVFSAILATGLQIESFHEYPVAAYQKFSWLNLGSDGWWRAPEGAKTIPLLFSLKARKK